MTHFKSPAYPVNDPNPYAWPRYYQSPTVVYRDEPSVPYWAHELTKAVIELRLEVERLRAAIGSDKT
jgi:hypothetical protein